MKYVMLESAKLGNIFLNKGEFLRVEPLASADKSGKCGLYRVTASGKTTIVYRWELDRYAHPWFTLSDSYRILSIIVYCDAVPVCDYRERVTVSWRDIYEVEESVIRLVALANYPEWDYADVHIAGDESGEVIRVYADDLRYRRL